MDIDEIERRVDALKYGDKSRGGRDSAGLKAALEDGFREAIGKADGLKSAADDAGREMYASEAREHTKSVGLASRFRAALDRLDAYTSTPNPMVFPGGGGGDTGGAKAGRPSIYTESWGAAVLKAGHGGSGGVKSLGPSGSAPVTVPLSVPIVSDSQRVLFLRSLIPNVADPSGRFSYLKQTVRTNNAAPVAAGGKKPTSVYTLERIDAEAVTIAHLSEPIDKADLDDAALLTTFVDDELRYGLDLAVDDQILNGDGTPPDMDGILSAGIGSQSWAVDILTTARKAITKLQVAEYRPDGWVLNPADWEAINLSASDLFAANPAMNPANEMTQRLYGFPVVVSNAMAAGTGLLGAFATGAVLHVRQEATIDWSENLYNPDQFGTGQGGTLFEANQIVFRAECRMGLEVSRPLAFVEIDLSEPS